MPISKKKMSTVPLILKFAGAPLRGKSISNRPLTFTGAVPWTAAPAPIRALASMWIGSTVNPPPIRSRYTNGPIGIGVAGVNENVAPLKSPILNSTVASNVPPAGTVTDPRPLQISPEPM